MRLGGLAAVSFGLVLASAAGARGQGTTQDTWYDSVEKGFQHREGQPPPSGFLARVFGRRDRQPRVAPAMQGAVVNAIQHRIPRMRPPPPTPRPARWMRVPATPPRPAFAAHQ